MEQDLSGEQALYVGEHTVAVTGELSAQISKLLDLTNCLASTSWSKWYLTIG